MRQWKVVGAMAAAAFLSPGIAAGQQGEDPLDTIIAILRQARTEAAEASVVGEVRAVLSAEASYRSSNGFYDELACLARPRECRPDDAGADSSFLAAGLASLETKLGYRRRFHRGPDPDVAELRRRGASATSTEAFAYTAVPESRERGTRSFCGDHTGRICYVEGGTPLVRNGRCTPCAELPVQGLGLLWKRERPRITSAQRQAVLAALETDPRVRSWPEEQKRLVLNAMEGFIGSAGETLYEDEELCQRGDAAICLGLGRRRLGYGEKEDAAPYYQRACEAGSQDGCFGLASYLTWKLRTAEDDASKRDYVSRGLGVAEPLSEEDPGNLDVLYYLQVLHNGRAATAADPHERDEAYRRSSQLMKAMLAARAEGSGHFGSFRDRFFEPVPPPRPRGPGGAPTQADPRGAGPPSTTPVRVGGDIKPPVKLRSVDPVYPEQARTARVQGTVILECVIDREGNVSSARVLRSIPLLDQAALDAVRQWVYTPTVVDGVAVPVIMTVTVSFSFR